MNRTEFYYDSRDNSSKIHAIKWVPDTDPVGILIIVHGMAEHLGRYETFAEYMCEKGFVVAGNEHLGHGDSVSQGPKGYFCSRDAATVVVRDVHRLKKTIQEEYPGLPIFIFGHSMGSLITRNYLTRYGTGIDGAIICGTGNENPAKSKAGLALIGALTKKYGPYHRSEMITKTVFSGPYKEFDLTGNDLDNSWLSKDVTIVQKYYDDPLNGPVFTLNGYNALISTVIYDATKPAYSRVPKSLPVLIVSGDRDPVGNFGKGPQQVYKNYIKAGLVDVTIKLFDDDRHEILNELDRQSVYDYIYDWISEHNH